MSPLPHLRTSHAMNTHFGSVNENTKKPLVDVPTKITANIGCVAHIAQRNYYFSSCILYSLYFSFVVCHVNFFACLRVLAAHRVRLFSHRNVFSHQLAATSAAIGSNHIDRYQTPRFVIIIIIIFSFHSITRKHPTQSKEKHTTIINNNSNCNGVLSSVFTFCSSLAAFDIVHSTMTTDLCSRELIHAHIHTAALAVTVDFGRVFLDSPAHTSVRSVQFTDRATVNSRYGNMVLFSFNF